MSLRILRARRLLLAALLVWAANGGASSAESAPALEKKAAGLFSAARYADAEALFRSARAKLRSSVLVEYWAEQAMPWLVGMTYKAIRTDRYKYIHWVNRGVAGELDELYDLDADPWELKNLNGSAKHAAVKAKLRRELGVLVREALGL